MSSRVRLATAGIALLLALLTGCGTPRLIADAAETDGIGGLEFRDQSGRR